MRESRFEIVRTDAGWLGRFVAANGREVWRTSETYKRRAGADRAVALLWEQYTAHDVVDRDERTPLPPPPTIEPPFYVTATIRGEEFWHDHEHHYRNCYGDDCTEGTPPIDTKVRGRMGSVTYGGKAARHA